MNILLWLVVALAICLVLWIVVDLLAGAFGGDVRLWAALKALLILGTLFWALQHGGLTALC